MQFCTPIITTAGKDAGINVIFGQGTLEFNRVVIGDGKLAPADIAAASDVDSGVLDAELVGYQSQGDSMLLRFTFNNKELEEGFDWTEYGIFATYTPNDGTAPSTILYCYAYDTTESPESVPAFTGSTSYYKAKFDLGVSVGNAESVTVELGDYTDFVAKEELDDHKDDTNNPHGVTKAQVGLGSVENVSVNGARPTFGEYSTLTNIVSGETTTGLWSKVKKAISTLQSHLTASNPHNIKPSKIGAAASTHNHSASDITTGILPLSRGGTGGNLGKIFSINSGDYTSINAGAYRSVRTLSIPDGTWIVYLNCDCLTLNSGGVVNVMLTDRSYNNANSCEFDSDLWWQTETNKNDYAENIMAVFILQSTGGSKYVTINPETKSSWTCQCKAVRIV